MKGQRPAPATLIQVPPARSPVGLCGTWPQGPTCHEAHSCCWHICTDSGFVLGSQNLSFNRSSPNWHHVWRCLCPFPQVTKHCEEKSASSGGARDALPAQHLPWHWKINLETYCNHCLKRTGAEMQLFSLQHVLEDRGVSCQQEDCSQELV